MNNILHDDRPSFTLGMELSLLLDFPEQLRRAERMSGDPSQIARALARWENEGGAVRPDNLHISGHDFFELHRFD